MKNTLTLAHHAVGISFAIIIVCSTLLLSDRYAPEKGIDWTSSETKRFQSFSIRDYAGLLRLTASRALEADAIVVSGFNSDVICDKEQSVGGETVRPVFLVDSDNQFTSLYPDEKFGKPTALHTGVPQSFSQFCELRMQNDYFVTDSKALRNALREDGVRPLFLAIAD